MARLKTVWKALFLTCILIVILSSLALGATYPSPTSVFYVNDYAGVLDNQTKQHIESIAVALESKTSAQVVVVTVNDIGDNSLEEYSLGLFREWGIGDSQKNNGVLILLDIDGRQSRIEVGYGLEGALPDGKTGRIQDQAMLPYYQQGNYGMGMMEGFNLIVNEIYSEYGYDDSFVGDVRLIDDGYRHAEEGIPPILILIGLAILIPLILLDFKFTGGMMTYSLLRMASRGAGRGSGRSGGGGSAGGGGSSRRW